jgi:prepilin-type N-terminal cleavage/methylation domain-containing protein
MKIRILPTGSKGFTILELLIVLFITGLSLSIVLLSAGRLRENSLFKGEVRSLNAILRYARELSLLERIPVTFVFDEENKNKYWLLKRDAIQNEHSLPEGFTVAGEPVTFFSKGNSTGGVIQIRDAHSREYICEIDPVLGTAKAKGVHAP